MTDLTPSLKQLGDALHAAAAVDLRRTAATAPRPVRRRRRLALAVAVAVIAIPGVAVAANALLSPAQVAQSLPQGALALLNTHPTCTTVTANVEYDCTLQNAPAGAGDAVDHSWLAAAEPSEDATNHINGGCRSLNRAGTHWHCYIGQAAVSQKIIGGGLLGQQLSGPTQG